MKCRSRRQRAAYGYFDYDGCCIYAYYGKIEIRNDGRDGKEIDIVCAGYLEGYEEHKEPDGTGEREEENE